jgi:hypothetical protein
MASCFSEVCLLHQLLQLDSTTNTLPSAKLVTPKGHSICISVETAKGGDLKVILQGPSMAVVKEVQLALMSRLVKVSICPISSMGRSPNYAE